MQDVIVSKLMEGFKLRVEWAVINDMGEFWAVMDVNGREFYGIGDTPELAIDDLAHDIVHDVRYDLLV